MSTKNLPHYELDEQIGFILRLAHQINTNHFGRSIGDGLSATQFSLLARLAERGPVSQNRIGRQISADGATVTGMIIRLKQRGLIETAKSSKDKRLVLVDLTDKGREVFERNIEASLKISADTVGTLTPDEAETLKALLRKMIGGTPADPIAADPIAADPIAADATGSDQPL